MTILVRCLGAGALFAGLAMPSACGQDCGPGTVEHHGECVSESFACGPGTILSNGECVAVVSACGDGTEANGTACALPGDGSQMCAAGTTFDAATQRCVTAVADHCGIDTIAAGTTCVVAARVQFIHNLEAQSAAVLDLYVDDVLVVNDLAYRTAAPFLSFAAGTHAVAVAAAGSATTLGAPLPNVPGSSISTSITIAPVTDNVAVLAGFNSVTFGIAARQVPRSVDADMTALVVVNGSPDASSPMDVENEGANEASESDDTTIADNVAFGTASAVVALAADRYLFEVTDASGAPGSNRYRVNLGSFGGSAVTIVASGYLSPPSGSAAFALLAFGTAGGAAVVLPHD